MSKFNPNSPWNPASPVDVTPQEYEKQVANWLASAHESLEQFSVNNLVHLSGAGGEYEFDAIAKFTAFKGANFTVLVECKRYNRPVERDHVMTLWAKLQDTNAQKAMLFATCGFQSGALEFAKSKNIATITFIAGDFLYETKSQESSNIPPAWVSFPKFAGIYMQHSEKSIQCSKIDSDDITLVTKWLLQE
jgi:restriction system protein